MQKIGDVKTLSLGRWVKGSGRIADIATSDVDVCSPDQKIRDVLDMFLERHSHMPVADKKSHVHGMLTSTDMLRVLGGWGEFKRVQPKNRPAVKVGKVMSRHILHIDRNSDIGQALDSFKKHRKGAYPVLHHGKLEGIVTESDIVKLINGRTGVKVSELMVRKPLVAYEKYTVSDVSKMLVMGGFKRLPVVRKNELVGMVSPREVLKFLQENKLLEKLERQKDSLRTVMNKDFCTANPEDDVYEAIKTMLEKGVGGLPVVSGNNELAGIFTQRDIVDALVI